MADQHKLLSEILAAEGDTSRDADDWDKQLLLSLTVANGIGLTSQIGLLQAAEAPSQAATALAGPAVVFLLGMALSAAAILAATRAVGLLSKSLFEQRQALSMSEPHQSTLLSHVIKKVQLSQSLDRGRAVLTGLAALAFVAGVGWTFCTVIHGALD